MNATTKKRVIEFAGLLCDEAISETQMFQLDELLREDAGARVVYRDYLRLHRQLQHRLQSQSATPAVTEVIHIGWRDRYLWVIALAAVVVLAVSTLFWNRPALDPENTSVVENAASVETPPIAVLTRSIDVEWGREKDRRDAGDGLEPGWLRIRSGVVEVIFSSGASMVLEGPAQLRIDTSMSCFAKRGKLAVNVPESAHGFTVRVRGGKIVDLGTSFAVDIDRTGVADVHVLEGEVVVSMTDDNEHVLTRQNLPQSTAVRLNPDDSRIEVIDFDAEPFASIQRERLVLTQPLKLQFDVGHRAGLYTGTNAPAHASGAMLGHERVWNQIAGDSAGTFVLADGNLCPYPLMVDYGHGTGDIDWNAASINGVGPRKARGVFASPVCRDDLHFKGNLGVHIAGLPAGRYHIYALCRSPRKLTGYYDVSIGVNLERQLAEPQELQPLGDPGAMSWEAGQTHAVGEVQLSGPNDYLTVITRYAEERSPLSGRAVLLGLQIVEIK